MCDTVLSTPLSLQNDMSEIRYTYTNANKKLKKLSNKNLALLQSSYFALTLMFYGRVDVTLNDYYYKFFLHSQRNLWVVWQNIEFLTTKKPSCMIPRKLHLKLLPRLLVRLCLCKMTSQIDTPSLVSIITSKNCLLSACQYGYCPSLWMFYGRVLDITLSVNE